MTQGRITVTLDLAEKAALGELAERQRRDPRAQAAYLIRQSLEQLGLLSPTPTPTNYHNRQESQNVKC